MLAHSTRILPPDIYEATTRTKKVYLTVRSQDLIFEVGLALLAYHYHFYKHRLLVHRQYPNQYLSINPQAS
jgi:hypothetical protein